MRGMPVIGSVAGQERNLAAGDGGDDDGISRCAIWGFDRDRA